MTAEEERILAWTLLGEAANQSDLGLAAIAHVIRNRSESGRYPSNPAAVAIQNNGRYYQFSAWNSPADDGNSPRARYPVGSEQFNRATRIVERVFSDTPGNDPTRGATHYYAPGGMEGGRAPYWWGSEARFGELKLGDHIFAIRHNGPVPAAMPTAAAQRPNGQSPIGNRTTMADVGVMRTGRSVQLPPLAPAGQRQADPSTFVYDPVQHALVPRGQTAAEVRQGAPSARMAQTGRSVVAGFSVPGGLPGMVTVDHLRTQGGNRIPAEVEPNGVSKDESRLPNSTGLSAPRFNSRGLSRDAVELARNGRAVAGALGAELQPNGIASDRNVPLPQRRPIRPVMPTPADQRPRDILHVIIRGGNYSREESSSSGSGRNYVQTQTGKVVEAGSVYRGTDGYQYRVESNGSITNTTSGSNSGRGTAADNFGGNRYDPYS